MVGQLSQLNKTPIIHPESANAFMKVLVSTTEGWDSHVMRVVEVEPSGYTPRHQHPWPHINYCIQGEGELMIAGVFHTFVEGSYAFVPQDTLHQFKNLGSTTLKFICIVPTIGHK
jgi:quercetin dioxygenase-like cupin family protein